MSDLLTNLNSEQRAAVTHGDGPLLILAGAGSGKTRALTHRIAYLIFERGVRPEEILAITFTNKAAAVMKERVAELLGSEAPAVWVATFHSTCARILRREAPLIGRERDFVIYDTADQRDLVREILAELRWDAKKMPPQAFLSEISRAKNELLGPEAYAARTATRTGDAWAERTARVYRAYQRRLDAANAFDFDDLLGKVVELFEGNPAVLARYQERWRYLLVDEYQDTNHAQYRLVRALAAKYRNLSVVGDDDQSIYAFRGADTRNILEFERDYPEARQVKLEQNYRSTVTVLEAANHLVRNNDRRKPKHLWTDNEEGDLIRYYQAVDQRDEAVRIAHTMAALRRAGQPLGGSAVVYRTNAQSRAIEEALMSAGLPYQVVGGRRFYDRKHIRDLIAYVRLVANPADTVSLKRIINTPKRGVGPATWAKIVAYAEGEAMPIAAALRQCAAIGHIGAAARTALTDLGALLSELQAQAATIRPAEALEALLERTGYRAELVAEGGGEARERLEDLDELVRLAEEFAVPPAEEGAADSLSPLAAFLEQVSLVADIDTMEDAPDRAVLMTVHTAKGLEFDNVFIAGLDEGLFPHQRSMSDQTELEEERRLCYVAITRARKRLFLSSSTSRVGFGGTSEPLRPSRFLGELPRHLLQVETGDGSPGRADLRRIMAGRSGASGEGGGRRSSVSWQEAAAAGRWAAATGGDTADRETPREASAVAATDLPQPGEKVRHPSWGEGTVISLTPGHDAAGTEITIAFPDLGLKRVLAGYARLERLHP